MLLYNLLHVHERLENNTVSDSSSMGTANMAVSKMYSKTEDCHLFIYLLLCISDLSTPPLFSNNINTILAFVYIVHVNEKWDEKWENNSVSDVNNTVLLQSRGVRQDRHKIMQL